METALDLFENFGTSFPSAVLSKPMPRTTLEVRWSSFPIKRLSGVSPDGDAGGGVGRWQNRLRLDPPLDFLVQPLDHIGGK